MYNPGQKNLAGTISGLLGPFNASNAVSAFYLVFIALKAPKALKAINSPISFTVIDSTFNNVSNSMQFGPNINEMDDEIISNLLGAR